MKTEVGKDSKKGGQKELKSIDLERWGRSQMRKKAAEIENRIENELMSISKSIYLSKDLGHLSGKFANELML